jgi:hypothetical protein
MQQRGWPRPFAGERGGEFSLPLDETRYVGLAAFPDFRNALVRGGFDFFKIHFWR